MSSLITEFCIQKCCCPHSFVLLWKGRVIAVQLLKERTCMPAFRRGHKHHLEEGAGDSSEEEQDLWVTPVFSIPCWLGSFSLSMLAAEQPILRYSHLPDIIWEAWSKAMIQPKVVEGRGIYMHSIRDPLIKSTSWICSACINSMTKAVSVWWYDPSRSWIFPTFIWEFSRALKETWWTEVSWDTWAEFWKQSSWVPHLGWQVKSQSIVPF